MITLPEKLFASVSQAKTVFVCKNKKYKNQGTFVYALADLRNHEEITRFAKVFKNGAKLRKQSKFWYNEN